MSGWENGVPEAFVAAMPGERVSDGDGFEATATKDYLYNDAGLFRRFAWCSFSVAESPAMSPKGEWLAVRCHWRDAKRKAAA